MSWDKIVGNEPVVRLLKGQLTGKRLAHTYLFVGARGVGKRTLALEFAKALECDSEITSGAASAGRSHDSESGDACDSCESCQKIAKGSYPDVIVVSAESETGSLGIDQVRNLTSWLSLTPYQGRWKVGLIEGADRLTEEAVHASLKLLEEPPEKSILLLTATGLQRLPATLISRCALVRCVPQGIEKVARFLKEREQLDPEVSRILAVGSGGRLGLALEFHRAQRLAAKNAVLDQLLTACRQKRPEIPLGTAPREEVEEALEWLAAWWRDLLLLNLKADPAWVIHQDRLPELQRIAGGLSVEELSDRVEWTYWVQEAIQRNASPRIALSTLFCRD